MWKCFVIAQDTWNLERGPSTYSALRSQPTILGDAPGGETFEPCLMIADSILDSLVHSHHEVM